MWAGNFPHQICSEMLRGARFAERPVVFSSMPQAIEGVTEDAST
jgi:hypothetical protein